MEYFKTLGGNEQSPVDRPISLHEIDQIDREIAQFRQLLREPGTKLEVTQHVLNSTYELTNRTQGKKMSLHVQNHGSVFPMVDRKVDTSSQTD